MLKKIFLVSFFCLITIDLAAQNSIPDIHLKTINGVKIQPSSILNDKEFSIISFWATWCIPCINELDAINELYPSWNKNYSINVFAISTDDSRSRKRVRPLISGKNWAFEVYLDENQEFKRSLNISGIPHTIVTYGSKIIHRRIGYSPGEEKDLINIISNYKQN